MRHLKIILILALFSTSVACNKQLDSLLDNPNAPSASTADVDLLLNTVQLSFTGFFDGASNIGGQLTRQQTWFGPLYTNGFSPNSFDGLWGTGYASIIKNANALIPLAQAQKRYISSGIAKVLKAYTIGTLVDNFGDIPYSEAVLGIENANPKVDAGATIYAAVLALLDDAIVDFGKTGAKPASDLYYGGNAASWITAANTLKLKFLMQTRKVDATAKAKIQTLFTTNNVIRTIAQDFNFKYGTNKTSPDSRHPDYAGNYQSNREVSEYMGDWFMWVVAAEKNGGSVSGTKGTTRDPRQRYYFYRQNTSGINVNEITLFCITAAKPAHYDVNMPFCYLGAGYWGRDHGDNSGTPPDGGYRTTWGVYPAGGEFDGNQAKSVSLEMGGKGAGILPIWNAEFTYFLEAEAAITNVITGGATSARTALNLALRASMAKVTGFPATVGVIPSATYAATSATIETYVSLVLAQYDAAVTDEEKLQVIMKEYYIATWGNGIEAYNNYRLTGYPAGMQPVLTSPNPGFFVRSFFYPSVYVNRNLNAPAQRTLGSTVSKVFWDNNPDNFIK
ncbi:MAG: SusD/RagB family nutrient-binding outer membrane lipoprotein [Sediminibacterium sp.]|nr:SusD/RagB family nutrient-binding outer membrane lipoprotein [Sediminibacterium sp.]MDP1811161.1 SusD/RagB family nutrient-binding outer membrane lipoprotein [Sediminibacterium sp.]MDP3128661.1 SusD/RagB family nutrient-binding outer membrane lipoprotein [Sediminibacterium sp.]MDP3665035.1 SusD/RagB family nutrient-binding outer membrane lipoprotein [Sediminibacterium sp.]